MTNRMEDIFLVQEEISSRGECGKDVLQEYSWGEYVGQRMMVEGIHDIKLSILWQRKLMESGKRQIENIAVNAMALLNVYTGTCDHSMFP